MPAKDIYHDTVRNALEKDGWTITKDPLTIKIGERELFIDLGAENLLAAEKGNRRIAVEIKSFVGKSDIADLQSAIGQYVMYHEALAIKQPDRTLYLAVTETIFDGIFRETIGELMIETQRLRLLVFDPQNREIIKWIE